MSEKLPNLWVFGDAIEILQGGKTTHKTNISLRKIVMDDVLYIPAERIRELIEKWRHKADVKSPVDVNLSVAWDSAANQLEALIAEKAMIPILEAILAELLEFRDYPTKSTEALQLRCDLDILADIVYQLAEELKRTQEQTNSRLDYLNSRTIGLQVY